MGASPESPPVAAPPGNDVAEGERAEVLEKEIALLGEEQAEAREVHLLFVGFDLREVGVVGEVGGQVLGEAHLGVGADVGIEAIGERVGRDRDPSSARRRRRA